MRHDAILKGYCQKDIREGVWQDGCMLQRKIICLCLRDLEMSVWVLFGFVSRVQVDVVRRIKYQGRIAGICQRRASKSAQFLAKAHLSLTGASGKTGLYYDNKDGWYMPFGTAPSTHIVKQSHVRLSGIVANEQLCLRTAKILGIDVPESFIISVGTGEHILFATKRFDRLMQEDSRVIDGKKFRSGCNRKILHRHSVFRLLRNMRR